MRTNAQGHPDKDYAVLNTDATVRILGIGDSVIFAWAVTLVDCSLIAIS